jgi:hypothetical protein
MNAVGVESGPSPAFFTIPSAPQWLFSKEDPANATMQPKQTDLAL